MRRSSLKAPERGLVHAHEAQRKAAVRLLYELDGLACRPDVLLLQRDIGDIVLDHRQGLAQQAEALLLIRFAGDALEQRIELGVGIAAEIRIAPMRLLVARRREIDERVERIAGLRRPAHQEEIGRMVEGEQLLEELAARLGIEAQL